MDSLANGTWATLGWASWLFTCCLLEWMPERDEFWWDRFTVLLLWVERRTDEDEDDVGIERSAVVAVKRFLQETVARRGSRTEHIVGTWIGGRNHVKNCRKKPSDWSNLKRSVVAWCETVNERRRRMNEWINIQHLEKSGLCCLCVPFISRLVIERGETAAVYYEQREKFFSRRNKQFSWWVFDSLWRAAMFARGEIETTTTTSKKNPKKGRLLHSRLWPLSCWSDHDHSTSSCS